jgi:ubiquitin-activating enzyme E1
MDKDIFFNLSKKNVLYSRQIGTYGEEMMQKLSNLKVLIIGLGGLGLETSKNLILSGPEKVILFDSNLVKLSDLGSNYFINSKNIGINRRDFASLEGLSKLNPFTVVELLNYTNISQVIENILILNVNVIVITEIISLENLKKINNICRNNNIKFIYGAVMGLSSFIFSDFTKEHYFYTNLNNNNKTYFCKNITNEKIPLVTINDEINILSLQDGDYVIFKNLNGMEELNNNIPKKIKCNDYKSFYILEEDTSNYSKYNNGGQIHKIVKPKKYEFKSFEESIKIPFQIKDFYNLNGFCEGNEKKLGRNLFLFSIILSLHNFFQQNNEELPELNDNKSSKDILIECKKIYEKIFSKILNDEKDGIKEEYINEEYQKFDEEFVLNTCRWSKAQIPPICSIVGGYFSQEIIKSIGLYEPINQWMFFDFYDTKIPSNINNKNITYEYKKTRYEEQISIFGDEIQEKLEKLNIFLIGAGAIGCEVLKNLAMMGISSKKRKDQEKYVVSVTDNDNIETSNLNRQFLFKNINVGQSKSEIACINIKKMNEDFQCFSYQQKVCHETEHIFNQKFWLNQDIIILAVDNIEARKYINSKCIKYEKILINSGTLGTEGKTELIIPHKTVSLEDLIGNETKNTEIPMCTIRSFPSNIDHCVEWSKEYFNNLFINYIREINNFINEKNVLLLYDDVGNELETNEKYYILKIYFNLIINNDKNEIENKLVDLSKYLIYIHFIRNIELLLKEHPIDSNNKDGTKFWSGTRIPPKILSNINNNKMIYQFIISFINILSKIFKFSFDLEKINSFLNKNMSFDNINNEMPNLSKTELKQKNIDFQNLIKNNQVKIKIEPEFFNKDNNETNYHIYFIQACSNLRASNYNINEIDYNQTLIKAGKIIPAVPTSTSSVAGFLCLQIYSLLQTDDIEYLKDSIMDLSTKELLVTNPFPPDYIESNIELFNNKFTVWDKIIMSKKESCKDIINYLKEKYNILVNYISIDNILILHLRKTKDPRVIENNNRILEQKIEDVYYEKKFRLLKDTQFKNIEKDEILFIQVYGKYNNKNICSFPLIKYFIK